MRNLIFAISTLLLTFCITGKSQCLSGAYDSDHDGIYDFFDLDNDNDGLLNQTECLFTNVDWFSIPVLSPGAQPQTVYSDINGDLLPYSCTIGNVALTPPTFPTTSGTVEQKNGRELNFKQSNYQRGGGLRASVTFDDFSLIKINASPSSSNITTEDTIVFTAIGASPDFRWVVWSSTNATFSAVGNSIKIAGIHPFHKSEFLIVGTEEIIGVDIYHIHSKSNTSQAINEASIGFSYLLDTDGDQVPDLLDLDSDNDGIPDAVEASGNNTLLLEQCSLDDDGNAYYPDNNNDNCPDGLVNGNFIQAPIDSDRDGIPDYREPDADADNCLDSEELNSWLPSTVNTWNDPNTVDDRGRILHNGTGFCLSPTSNAWQKNCTGVCFGPEKDFDGDHIADFSDLDQDNDGILNQYETNCPFLKSSRNTTGKGSFRDFTFLLTWDDPIFNNGIQDGESTTFKLSNGLEAHLIFNYQGTNNWQVTDLGANPFMGFYYNTNSSKDAITTNHSGTSVLHIQVTVTLDGSPYPAEFLVLPTTLSGNLQESLVFSSPWLFPVEIIDGGGNYNIPTGTNPPYTLRINASGNEGTTIFKTRYSDSHSFQLSLSNANGFARGFGIALLLGCDFDKDGYPNHRDLDADQDGLIDAIEAQCPNAGLTIDCAISNQPIYPDYNQDGCADGIHLLACSTAPNDFDHDGAPNFLDLDSDNDRCADAIEVEFHYLVPVNLDTVIHPLFPGSVGTQGQVQDDSVAFCLPVPNYNWLDTSYQLACVRCDLPDLTVVGPSAFFICPSVVGKDSFDLSGISIIDLNPESNNSLNISFHNAFPPDTSNLLINPVVQPLVTTTYYILDTEEIHCTDYVPITIFVDNIAPIATSLPDSSLNCGEPLPFPVADASDYLIQNANCRKNTLLSLANANVFNDFTNPICSNTSGNTTKAVLSDIFNANGVVDPDVDGSLDVSFDVELISILDVYGGDPMMSLPDPNFRVEQTVEGLTGEIPVNTDSSSTMSSGDVKGYMVTVKFAQHLQLYSDYFNLEFTGMNTPGSFFESSALQLLDFQWNPFNGKLIDANNYSGYYHGKPNLPYGIDCSAGTAPSGGFIDANPWKIAGPGVMAFQDNNVIDSNTDLCNPVQGQPNPNTDAPQLNAFADMNVHPLTRIGGFRYIVLVENVAGAKSSNFSTNGSGVFTSSLKHIRLNRVCLGDPYLVDNNPFVPPTIYYLGDVSDHQIPENITRTYAVSDICGNTSTVHQNFVRARGSDLSCTTTMVPGNIAGISAIGVAIQVSELGGFDTDGSPITVRIPKDPRLVFAWDPTLLAVAFNSVQNNQWTYTTSYIFHEFTYNGVISGGNSLWFGFEATYDPQGTYGQTTITSTVVPNSGGECRLTNNSDSEILIYFD